MAKTESVSSLKKKAWKLMSEYIRRRDSDWKGFAKCCTCGVIKPWKEQQAGHFLGGRRNSILFDTRNIHAQCSGCNLFKQGNTVKYFRFMQAKYGDEVIEELERLDRIDKQFTPKELKDLIEEIKWKIQKLK